MHLGAGKNSEPMHSNTAQMQLMIKPVYHYGTLYKLAPVAFVGAVELTKRLTQLMLASSFVQDFHCHLSTSEVVGYLGGSWCPQSQSGYIFVFFVSVSVCTCIDRSHFKVFTRVVPLFSVVIHGGFSRRSVKKTEAEALI